METLNFAIENTAISLVNYSMPTPYLTGRNTDYLCWFELTNEWDGLTKYATFYNTRSGKTEARLLSEGMCRIPYAVLTYGDLKIGVVGKNGRDVVKSSLLYILPVQPDAAEHEPDYNEVDETIFEQIIARLAQIDRGIQSAAVADGHLYIYLTNDERIDCGSIVSEVNGHNIEFAYVNADGELVLVRTNGEQVNCGAIGGANFPEITPQDEGKMLQIIDGAWTLVDPPSSLPAVTALENGQVLRVVDGAWDVTSTDRAVTSAYINEDGELILVFNDGGEYEHPMDGLALPVVTAEDENKILKVVQGEWALVNQPDGVLPAVSLADDGKILQVVDGAWQIVEADLSDGTGFTVGNGLEIVNGILQLDMGVVETKVQEAVGDESLTTEDVDDLFDEIFGS